MKSGVTFAVAVVAVLLLGTAISAHHPISAKFDDTKPQTLSGVVTLVDWRNPHVHIYMNVRTNNDADNWAIELESPIDLQAGGWTRDSVKAGDGITVTGITARNGSRQLWATKIVMTGTGKEVLHFTPPSPPALLANRPTPRWPDKQPRLGPSAGGTQGYWAFPSSTVLAEATANVPAMDQYGLLKNVADAKRVAPMQPWALGLYEYRQKRFLQDDPTYINCKPPGGPRQFQLSFGVQFVEDRDRQRIFVLIGGGNNNYRIIYLDGRGHAGQVGGDDDNPLYYGRAVGKWEADSLVVDTRGFNEDFWFTNGGLPHTEQLKLSERFTRPDLDTLKYELTIDDAGAYTKPWSTSWTLRWVAGEELPVHICQDNRP
jgi:Family of unknown function (DUF6152)